MRLSRKTIERIGFEVFGTGSPRPEELQTASSILAEAPTTAPLEIAQYFERLQVTNSDGEKYNAEWRDRSNPVIVSFFAATNYSLPITDRTKWCAAFVNWCLRRAKRPITNSASSGSFRCFGSATISPAPGDIAVFKNRGQDEPCSGSGHVAFWISQVGDSVEVLGGNQGSRVRTSRYPVSESGARDSPWLISVRRVA